MNNGLWAGNNSVLAMAVCALTLVSVLASGVWLFLDKPTVVSRDVAGEHMTKYSVCEMSPYFYPTYFCTPTLVMMYGLYLAVRVRVAYAQYNESVLISLTLYNLALSAVVFLFLYYISVDRPTIRLLVDAGE